MTIAAITPQGYTCPRHQRVNPRAVYCPDCVSFLAGCPPAEAMTQAERVTELHWWLDDDTLTVPFTDLHQRIDHLMGRPVLAREFRDPQRLIEEAEGASVTDPLEPRSGAEAAIDTLTTIAHRAIITTLDGADVERWLIRATIEELIKAGYQVTLAEPEVHGSEAGECAATPKQAG